jgi:transposase
VFRERFFRRWSQHGAGSNRFIIFDITSVSSYAQGTDMAERGYNRDHESPAQINLGVIYGEPSGLPLCYALYPGSIHDVSTLRNTVCELEILGEDKSLFVLDKGFYSQANLREMREMNFIIPLPVRTCVYRELGASVRGIIRSAEYAIAHRKQVYYCMRKTIELAGSKLTAHIYLDERRQAHEREVFLRTLLETETLVASQGFTTKAQIEEYLCDQAPGMAPYFTTRKRGSGSILIRSTEKIDTVLDGMGIFVLITNSDVSSKMILNYYRERDGVEKYFDSLKNNLYLKRLRVHSKHTLEGLLFIEFIAMILRSRMSVVLKQSALPSSLYIPELLSELRKLKQITFGKKRALTEVSKSQKDIFKAFEISLGSLT